MQEPKTGSMHLAKGNRLLPPGGEPGAVGLQISSCLVGMYPMSGLYAARFMHALDSVGSEPTGGVSAGALLCLLGLPAAHNLEGCQLGCTSFHTRAEPESIPGGGLLM